MKLLWTFFYSIILSLWVGGMSIFTFLVTPAVFHSYNRDMAGQIVGTLFPGYFWYLLVVSVLALALLIVSARAWNKPAVRWSIALAAAAMLVNAFVLFRLYPAVQEVKKQVVSFERESPDSPMRKQFIRLHGVSSVLNLLVLADGMALLLISPVLRKTGN